LKRLIFDTSPLSHFARAQELDTLAEVTAVWDRTVTQAVLDELVGGAAQHPVLALIGLQEWLTVVAIDTLDELRLFAEYARRLGSGSRDIGEAATLAWAEAHGATAVVDERAGTRHGRERGVDVHGTLWLIAQGLRTGSLDADQCEALVDALRAAEAWFPCSGSDFMHWAQAEGLL
jgi:predicted nucleic acid-binding protein